MEKTSVHKAVTQLVDEKISRAILLMEDAQHSANNDTKSSAGDKHETSRAMAMLEKDKAASQLNEAHKLKQLLSRIDPENNTKQVGLGSLVATNNGLFYVSVGLGKVTVANETIYCISMASPLGKVIAGKQQGECVLFNKNEIRLVEVE
jgi:transcription elongation GreA/GreB family factor